MNKDLTTGKPASVLLRFTLPMLLSVAFQQLYNIADSVIAGKFAGEDALAAVGASYPVTMIFMAVAFGMNIGISVVISQLFGAKDFKEMKTAAYTGFISVAVLGVVLTVVGTVLCEPILRMLGTPENIMEDTALYLAIYIWGLLFLFIYNISFSFFQSGARFICFFCFNEFKMICIYIFIYLIANSTESNELYFLRNFLSTLPFVKLTCLIHSHNKIKFITWIKLF